jgi:hypothetical protein
LKQATSILNDQACPLLRASHRKAKANVEVEG